MDTSILHIKVPHELHIAIKVKAMQAGKSMNQFVWDLLDEDIGEKEQVFTKNVIKLADNIIKTPKQAEIVTQKMFANKVNQVCKIHGTPLDGRGRCLVKGCKYN